uniref:Uncharacterized protein n=1 Tax=Plectus sambesii TaxID=2011161 RepID=A0A914XN15_9BILA
MAESTPTTPTAKTLSVEDPSNKHLAVEKRMSIEKRTLAASAGQEETPTKAVIHQQKRFRAGHESFRLRMFQEQCGFEPVTVLSLLHIWHARHIIAVAVISLAFSRFIFLTAIA